MIDLGYATVPAIGPISAAALILLLGLAGWMDILWRRIPNLVVAAIGLLWLPSAPALGLAAATTAGATALTVLGAGIAVWRLGWLGGGDVKLIAALSLWAGPAETPVLLLVIAVSGGALAMVSLTMRYPAVAGLLTMVQAHAASTLPPGFWRTTSLPMLPNYALIRRSPFIPYGVAVAAGGCWLVYRLLTA